MRLLLELPETYILFADLIKNVSLVACVVVATLRLNMEDLWMFFGILSVSGVMLATAHKPIAVHEVENHVIYSTCSFIFADAKPESSVNNTLVFKLKRQVSQCLL